jgi:hypothetical protein
VQVDGTPAVARAGRHKKDEQVLLPYHFFKFASVVPCLAQGIGLTSDAARPPARPPGAHPLPSADGGVRAVRAGCSPRVGNWKRQFTPSHLM